MKLFDASDLGNAERFRLAAERNPTPRVGGSITDRLTLMRWDGTRWTI